MVHGSRGPEDQCQRERSARDPLYTSRCTCITFFFKNLLFVHCERDLIFFITVCLKSVFFRPSSNLFVPASGPGPFPGLLDMWGGGGGLVEYRASLLASHGYASFALKYLTSGELGLAELELNYFEVRVTLLPPELLRSV